MSGRSPQTAPPPGPPPDFDIVDALARVADRQNLSRQETCAVIRQIMSGATTPAQIGALLMGLRMKGETVDELAGAAEVMRELATPVHTQRTPLLDTCGTGGDGRGTFNISTAVAFVAAGAGVAVAKHGNRSVSSRSGSADVLEALGVGIDLDAGAMGRCLDEVGLAFLFAPKLHAATRYAVGPRREMKMRTLFNLLGPLTNPAAAHHQLLGVFAPDKARLVADALALLGSRRAWVVHGLDGLDEISLIGPTLVLDVEGGGVRERMVSPSDAGCRAVADVPLGGDPAENAQWLLDVLDGRRRDASFEMVLLNAAAALLVCGRAADLVEGRQRALDSIEGGAARRVLDELRTFTRSAGPAGSTGGTT